MGGVEPDLDVEVEFEGISFNERLSKGKSLFDEEEGRASRRFPAERMEERERERREETNEPRWRR